MKEHMLVLPFLLWSVSTPAETVFVVESYHSEYLWDASYKTGLDEVLGDRHELIYFEMDTKRLPDSEYQRQADAAWKQYQALSPALVVLADDNALKYLGHKFVDTSTPVVYLGINANPRRYGVVNAPHITGVLERPMLRRSILMLNKILPVKRALLLLDSKETSKVIKADSFYGKESIKLQDTLVDIKLVSHFDTWKDLVLHAGEEGYDIIIPALYHTLVDSENLRVLPSDVIEWTSVNTPVPTFGFWDFSIGANRNIGGYVISGYEQGVTAGKMAATILSGTHRVRPITLHGGMFMFSRSQLRNWRLKLPAEIQHQTYFVD